METGYIKLHRKVLESQCFQNDGLLKVWIWCLLKATYKEVWTSVNTGRGVTEIKLYPGQFVFGRKTAAKELKMKPSTVWKRIDKLKRIGNIAVKSDSHYSIVSIINWEAYQLCDKKSDRQVTGKEQPSDTYKNSKEGKEKERGVPHEEIIGLYQEILPEMPAVKTWTEKRKKLLRARWNEDEKRQSLDWWNGFFNHIRGSPFLMSPPSDRPWRPNLEWMLKETNFVNICEGKYHK